MFKVLTCLTVEHDWRLVLLAVLICFLASLTAINLFHRARAASGRTRLGWLATAGAAAGCGDLGDALHCHACVRARHSDRL